MRCTVFKYVVNRVIVPYLSARERRVALTLAEVVLSIGLMAIVVIIVLGVLARFLSTQGKSAAQTAGRILAAEILDQSAAIGPNNWGFAQPTDLTGSRELVLPNETKPTEFRYELTPFKLRSDPDEQGILWELQVKVWWWTVAPSSRAEQGSLSVEAHRVVYFER